jgi:hypothetical protein
LAVLVALAAFLGDVAGSRATGLARGEPLGEEDATARREAVARLEGARSAAHRRAYELSVPQTSVPLSGRYRLRYHAAYVDWNDLSRALEITRTPAGARAELLTPTHLYRRALDAKALDRFVRVVFYLIGAKQVRRDAALGFYGVRMVSHEPERTLEVVGDGGPLVRSGPAQPVERALEEDTDLAAFAHTQVTLELERLMGRELMGSAVALDDRERQALARRLEEIPRGSPPLADYRRGDYAAVVARLIGAQLLRLRDREAVELLERKGLSALADELALRTAPEDERVGRVAAALCAASDTTYDLGLKVAEELGAPARGAVRWALGCTKDEHHLERLIDLFGRLSRGTPVSLEERSLLERVSDKHATPLLRVAAARVLARDGSVESLRLLEETAGRPPRSEMEPEQRGALEALVEVAGTDGERRRAYAALAAQKLAQMPLAAHEAYSGMGLLVDVIGRLDPRPHDAALRRLLAHADASLVLRVVEVFERYDARGAVQAARARLRRYAAAGRPQAASEYDWNVDAYLELLLRQGATDALPELAQVARRAHAAGVPAWQVAALEALMRALTAKDEAAGARAVLDFVAARRALSAGTAAVLITRYAVAGLSEARLEEARHAHAADEPTLWNL